MNYIVFLVTINHLITNGCTNSKNPVSNKVAASQAEGAGRQSKLAASNITRK